METLLKTSRRNFIKLAATAGGGLFLGFNWETTEASSMRVLTEKEILAGDINFNSYLSISPEGIITIFSPNPELGQNIKTSFPMIVAEELDADWSKVNVLQAPLDTRKFDRQLTGGSGAIPHSWRRLRSAGATARYLLISAAAKRWNVDPAECTTENSFVIHTKSGNKLSYGELAEEASKMQAPASVTFKDRKDFKLIGTDIRNVSNHSIITGKGVFGLDFYREGMVYAMIQRPPAFGTKIKSVNDAAAKAMPGIIDVVTFKNNVAIVGKSTWQIMKARKAVKIEYEKDGNLESTSDHDKLF